MMASFIGYMGKNFDSEYDSQFDHLFTGSTIIKENKTFSEGVFFLSQFSDLSSEFSDEYALLMDNDWVVCINGTLRLGSDLKVNEITNKLLNDPSDLRGEFCAIVYARAKKELFLIRDSLGHRPLYYCDTDSYLMFSTDLSLLKNSMETEIQMDDNWITDSLSALKSETWRTPYEGIRKVSPATVMRISKEIEINPYLHFPDEFIDDEISYDTAVNKMKILLQNALSDCVAEQRIVGAELSGGLDSSAVASLLIDKEVKHIEQFICFSHGFSDQSLGKFFPYQDERKYIELLKKEKNITKQYYCDADQRGVLSMLKHNIMIQSGPTQQSFSMFSDLIYQNAKKEGVRLLLSGFGGDEGVSSRAQGIFEELRFSGNKSLLKKEIKDYVARRKRSKLEYVLRYVLLAHFPAIYNLIKRIVKGRVKTRFSGFAINKSLLKNKNLHRRYKDLKGLKRGETVSKSQKMRLTHNHVSQRLEYSYIDAKHYGIEYAYPLLDMDLLMFYLSLPVNYKFRNGMGRAVFRDALIGILPEKIRLRTDKYAAAIPTVHQRLLNDFSAIIELINVCENNNTYHYIDYEKMRSWAERLKGRNSHDKTRANPLAFFNSLQILLLQQMERTGEFKSGIKY